VGTDPNQLLPASRGCKPDQWQSNEHQISRVIIDIWMYPGSSAKGRPVMPAPAHQITVAARGTAAAQPA
jgi:hypothetical protein